MENINYSGFKKFIPKYFDIYLGLILFNGMNTSTHVVL